MPSPPLPPTNVILQTGNQKNFLTWNQSIGASSYSIQRGTDGLTFTTLGTSSNLGYLDSAVVVGTSYYYQVAGVNANGTSSYIACYPTSIVPCLPGQINLGYLRYMAQLVSDKLTSQYLTTDEWNFNLNQSASELYDQLISKWGEDYFFAPPLYISLSGQISYPLPDGSNYPVEGIPSPAMYKLSGIDSNISGSVLGPNAGWIPIARMNWTDRNRYNNWPGVASALNNIYEMCYRVMGNQLFLFPQNQNMLIRVWYIPIVNQLLQDTDIMPYSISGWSEYVIIDAAMKAMRKEESSEKWALLAQNKSALIERIQDIAANRDVGQPNTVSNIRAVMSDPGFSNWGNGFGGGGFGGGGAGY